jgi:hypothetical protein
VSPTFAKYPRFATVPELMNRMSSAFVVRKAATT